MLYKFSMFIILQCVAVCCSVLPTVLTGNWIVGVFIVQHLLQYVAVCCSVLQCVAVCCSVLPTVLTGNSIIGVF